MTNRVINIIAFAVLTLLWLAFIVALLINHVALDTVWQSFRGWPFVAQILVGLLVLPVVIGLWIWETSWPMLLRLVLVIGLAAITVYTFFPKKTGGQSEGSAVKP